MNSRSRRETRRRSIGAFCVGWAGSAAQKMFDHFSTTRFQSHRERLSGWEGRWKNDFGEERTLSQPFALHFDISRVICQINLRKKISFVYKSFEITSEKNQWRSARRIWSAPWTSSLLAENSEKIQIFEEALKALALIQSRSNFRYEFLSAVASKSQRDSISLNWNWINIDRLNLTHVFYCSIDAVRK